ncbi:MULTISPECIES: hypothetical protein [unclassified Streptomyces]|uniref:hypothetical protein n=1 Tax=unclassified Streptomyces TaxID=2593676 RepID=UPI00081D529A|nr:MULTISPECIES: hypothetical protein [unclassified Streptomyces]MYR93077.1 hypothetical protein [Streptomyces sp. SID4937]SCD46062.1 hypothetical protein GA0115243_102157 [Streptomyces sp. ScaeMP-e83]
MPYGRVTAAQFIARKLSEPYEAELGGHNPEATHHLLAAVHADLACPPSGHFVSWNDCYAGAQVRPLPHKASFVLDNGHPRPLPAHLTGAAARRFLAATRIALRIQQAARLMPLGNQG